MSSNPKDWLEFFDEIANRIGRERIRNTLENNFAVFLFAFVILCAILAGTIVVPVKTYLEQDVLRQQQYIDATRTIIEVTQKAESVQATQTSEFAQSIPQPTQTVQVLQTPTPIVLLTPTLFTTPVITLVTPTIESTQVIQSTFEKIINKGKFVAIVRINSPPFSFIENDQRVGFEIDLMREFAKRWFEDENAVEFLPVESSKRISSLLSGKGDIIAAALTITKERRESINFSEVYFQDGQRLLVKVTSGIKGVCDLQFKKVGVIKESSGIVNIKKEAQKCGFSLDDNLTEFLSHSLALEALRNDEIVAFTTDGILLEQYEINYPELEVVANDFSIEPYGFGFRKDLGDEQFSKLVNFTLQAIKEDGTFGTLYCRYFGNDNRPFPIRTTPGEITDPIIEEMVKTNLPLTNNTCLDIILPRNHIVQDDDWLSKLAKKYYGNSSPDYWQIIYDANKELIGNDPNVIEINTVLKIPKLPNDFVP